MKDYLRFLSQGDVRVVNTIPNQDKKTKELTQGKDGAFAFVQMETEMFGVTYRMMHVRQGGPKGLKMLWWKES